jgi:hypothetical protein
MAMEEVSARDTGWRYARDHRSPSIPPHRVAPGSAGLSDKGSRPMSVAASEADTGTCMAEGLSGSQRAEAPDGRVGRRQPGMITPPGWIKAKAIRVRPAGRGSRGGLKQPSDQSVRGGATHRGVGQLWRLLLLHDLSRAAVSVPGQFCSSVVGLWPASVTRPPQGPVGHPAPGPAGAGRVHGRAPLCERGRRHTSPLPPEEAKSDTLALPATRRRFPGPGHSRPRSVEPAQSAADFTHERADGARDSSFPEVRTTRRRGSITSARGGPRSGRNVGTDVRPRSTARRFHGVVRKTTGEGTELPVPSPAAQQPALDRDS